MPKMLSKTLNGPPWCVFLEKNGIYKANLRFLHFLGQTSALDCTLNAVDRTRAYISSLAGQHLGAACLGIGRSALMHALARLECKCTSA
jgi:hypothetical protein